MFLTKIKLNLRYYLLNTYMLVNNTLLFLTNKKIVTFSKNKVKIAISIVLVLTMLNNFKNLSNATQKDNESDSSKINANCYAAPAPINDTPIPTPKVKATPTPNPTLIPPIKANCYAVPAPINDTPIPTPKTTPKAKAIPTPTSNTTKISLIKFKSLFCTRWKFNNSSFNNKTITVRLKKSNFGDTYYNKNGTLIRFDVNKVKNNNPSFWAFDEKTNILFQTNGFEIHLSYVKKLTNDTLELIRLKEDPFIVQKNSNKKGIWFDPDATNNTEGIKNSELINNFINVCEEESK